MAEQFDDEFIQQLAQIQVRSAGLLKDLLTHQQFVRYVAWVAYGLGELTTKQQAELITGRDTST